MPISNEDQYQRTRIEADKFEQAIVVARRRPPSPGVHPRVHTAEIEALESELAALREQLDAYERLESQR
jgi:hypothetical protein